jgi:hypothetical protein
MDATHTHNLPLSGLPDADTTIPQTTDVLTTLLKENTGRHPLDSGSAYGRHWERNQQIDDFETDTDTVSITLHESEVGPDNTDRLDIRPTVHVYDWLKANLTYDETADAATRTFHAWATTDDRADRSWLARMEDWVGTGTAVNTYNDEYDIKSQILQFVPFRLAGPIGYCDEQDADPAPGELVVDDAIYRPVKTRDPYDAEFVLLQVHNGCDVRGGYTPPIAFRVVDPDYLYHQPYVPATCDTCDARWEYRGGRWRTANYGREADEMTARETNQYGTPRDWVARIGDDGDPELRHDHLIPADQRRDGDTAQQPVPGEVTREQCDGRIRITAQCTH